MPHLTRLCVALLFFVQTVTAGEHDPMLGAEQVLADLTDGVAKLTTTDTPRTPGQQLIADITAYADRPDGLAADQAAQGWLELLGRIIALDRRTFLRAQAATGSDGSVLASLVRVIPGPDTWAIIGEGIAARVDAAPDLPAGSAASLRLLACALTDNHIDAVQPIAELEQLTKKLPGDRETVGDQLRMLARHFYTEQQERDSLIHNFERELERHEANRDPNEWVDEIETPDLVTLVGLSAPSNFCAGLWCSKAYGRASMPANRHWRWPVA